MFQYCSNTIDVQTHCWGFNGVYLESPSVLEQVAISNALKYGRAGKGVVIVRSGLATNGKTAETQIIMAM